MNIDTIIPPMRSSSQYYKAGDLELPEEYDNFLKKFTDGSVLVAFGTTFQPLETTLQGIIETAREKKNTGFVVSLKDTWKPYKMV